MTIPVGVKLETINALQDAKSYIGDRGNEITLRINDEGNVERDIYGAIKKRVPTQYSFHAFPINYNPTQEQIEKRALLSLYHVLQAHTFIWDPT